MVRFSKQLFSRRVATLARFALVWLVPAALALNLKCALIGENGLDVTAAGLERGGEEPFSPLEILSFYRADLLWAVVLIPAVTLFLTSGLRPRWRAATLGLVSFLVSCALFAELQSVFILGRMMSLTLATDAMTFANCCAPMAKDYFGLLEYAQLAGIAVLTAGLSWWAARGALREAAGVPTRRLWRVPLLGVWGLAWVAAAAAWLPRLPAVPFHDPVYVSAVKTFFCEDRLETAEFEGLPAAELAARYRELTHAPGPPAPSPYRGKAKDYDVLIVVLETTPARCLPIDGDLSEMPNMARLRERAFVAPRHHSTYSYTSRAVFSVVTGWHPSTLARQFDSRHPQLNFPGVFQSLKATGYQTALYAPDSFTFKVDNDTYKRAGIEKRYYVEEIEGPNEGENQADRRVRLDRAALKEMLGDIDRWNKRGQRYAALFLPQIGHGPWIDFTGGKAGKDLKARDRKILSIEDRWLGEILEVLKRNGRLDKTLIVLVGDHGIRYKSGDPTFRPGMIDEYTFHIPLLVYAPGALAKRFDVPWMTSHIDIPPTLLELMGVTVLRGSEQGSPVWDGRIAKRNNYFLAAHLFGADGYCSGGRYFMWNHLTGAVYESDCLHFEVSDVVPSDSARYEEIVGHLKRVAAIYEVWASSRCPGGSAYVPPPTAQVRH